MSSVLNKRLKLSALAIVVVLSMCGCTNENNSNNLFKVAAVAEILSFGNTVIQGVNEQGRGYLERAKRGCHIKAIGNAFIKSNQDSDIADKLKQSKSSSNPDELKQPKLGPSNSDEHLKQAADKFDPYRCS